MTSYTQFSNGYDVTVLALLSRRHVRHMAWCSNIAWWGKLNFIWFFAMQPCCRTSVHNMKIFIIKYYLIYTIELKFSPHSSFLTLTTFSHSGVFLQITTEPIWMIFHVYNTKTYTKECGYLLIQKVSSIFNNNNMTSQNCNSFSDEMWHSCHILPKRYQWLFLRSIFLEIVHHFLKIAYTWSICK